jgi:hypothetical protein
VKSEQNPLGPSFDALFLFKKGVKSATMKMILNVLFICSFTVALSPVADTSFEYRDFYNHMKTMFNECTLDGVLNLEAFEVAMIGYSNIKGKNILSRNDVITIIDYTRPSTDRRFYVIDLEAKRLLFNTYVSHGKYTGDNDARDFSNQRGTKKSSLGFYVTRDAFYGKHNYSLDLDGIDTSFNDNARVRGLIVHGAWYVSEEMKKKYGRMGKSWGCPAVPLDEARAIIDAIKNGSCLFIYFNDDEYLKKSKYLELKSAIENKEQN